MFYFSTLQLIRTFSGDRFSKILYPLAGEKFRRETQNTKTIESAEPLMIPKQPYNKSVSILSIWSTNNS